MFINLVVASVLVKHAPSLQYIGAVGRGFGTRRRHEKI